jgi:hypothetical protein
MKIILAAARWGVIGIFLQHPHFINSAIRSAVNFFDIPSNIRQ